MDATMSTSKTHNSSSTQTPGENASTTPFLPPEITLKVLKAAFKPVVMYSENGQMCLPKNPHEPIPDVSDLFQGNLVPDDYLECSWDRYQRSVEPKQCSHLQTKETIHDGDGEHWTSSQWIPCEKSADLGSFCWAHQRGNTAILLTRSDIYEEAVKILYSNTTFSFLDAIDFLSFIRALRSHGHQNLVKHLELTLGFPDGKGDLEILFPWLCDDAIKKAFPQLETVTITVFQGCTTIRWPSFFRQEWFADAREWDEVFRNFVEIARPFSSLENVRYTVEGLASDCLAVCLAEAVRLQDFSRIPMDAQDIARRAQDEYRKAMEALEEGEAEPTDAED